jgi:hypothetical protein
MLYVVQGEVQHLAEREFAEKGMGKNEKVQLLFRKRVKLLA